jgi:surface protein
MACRRPFNYNNFIRFERVYGGLTLAELQVQGIAALCNPADIAPPFNLFGEDTIGDPVLTWDYEASGFIDGFILYRNTTGINLEDSPYDVIADPLQRSYTDLVTVSGTTYYYMIKATNGDVLSAPSNIVEVTIINAFTFEINSSTAGLSGVGNFRPPLNKNAINDDLDVYVEGVNVGKALDFWSGSVYELTTDELGSSGTKTISLAGTMSGWTFNNGGDKLKLTDIIRWGTFDHNNLVGAFYGCDNIRATITATDAPNFVGNGSNQIQRFMHGCLLFNTNINHWNVSTIENFFAAFPVMTAFNQPLNLWDVSNASNFESMFQLSAAFNQDISGWDVSSVTTFAQMFNAATNFNYNLGNWQLRSAGTTLTSIFASSGMSTANYTDTIVGWANNIFNSGGTPINVNMATQTGRTFQNSRSGGTNFATAGDARTYLVTTLGWTISGDTVIA